MAGEDSKTGGKKQAGLQAAGPGPQASCGVNEDCWGGLNGEGLGKGGKLVGGRA